jgi:hypothetical protein
MLNRMRTGALSTQYGMRQRGLDLGFEFRGAAANMVGSSTQQWGNMIGSAGGAMFNAAGGWGGIQSSLNNFFNAPAAGTIAGVNTSQVGVYGGNAIV